MGSLLLLVGLALASPAQTDTCRADQLKVVIRDDDTTAPYLLVTASGARLRLAGQDFIDPRGWSAGAALKICLKPATAEAVVDWFSIENSDRGETLVAYAPRPAHDVR